MKPFRWNIKKREQLGRLLEVESAPVYAEYFEHLVECASKVVARSSNRKIIFVGRSPENIFDYLSGIFLGTSHEGKLDLLNISNRFKAIESIRNNSSESYNALKSHLYDLEVSPQQIIQHSDGICFTDLVAWGGTFERLFEFLQLWAIEDKLDFPAIVGKLSFLGITRRSKNSPNTWRWQQNADWVQKHSKLITKNISVPWQLWDYLGNRQSKVAKINYPERWADRKILLPPRDESNLRALKQAYLVYNLGMEQKRDFAELLASSQEFKEVWLRKLVNELKRSV